MKIIDRLRDRVTNLPTVPRDELGRWTRFLRYQVQLGRFCAERLKKDNAMAMSSALSFRTIFALIPALVLAVIILKPFGLVETTKIGIQNVLSAIGVSQIAVREESVMPMESGPWPSIEPSRNVVNLAETIERLVGQVERKLTFGRVGPVGVVVLIWTVLTLLTTMERSLNRIFSARRVRPLGRRVLLYWSVITLCPLLLVTAIYLGRLAAQALQDTPVLSWVLSVVAEVAPILVGILLLAMVYALMPNTKVNFVWALGGATVAIPLWLVAKWAFALYVTNLVAVGSLYGTLGLLPLFLLWLNLSWLLFLFGAEIAHTGANLTQMQLAEESEKFVPTPSAILAAALAVAKPYLAGLGPVTTTEVARKLKLPLEVAEGLLERLTGMRVVTRVDAPAAPAYVLARPPEKIPMTEILQIDQVEEPAPAGAPPDAEIAETVASFKGRARGALGKFTLAEVLAGE
jgi:membrane protein